MNQPMLKNDIATEMRLLAERSRAAYGALATASSDQKNQALRAAADTLRAQQEALLSANGRDMQAGRDAKLSKAMLDRLELSPARIEAMAAGLEAIAELPDPVGRIMSEWDSGKLHIQRVSVPLGVIGIIYESRPNVTADAGGLCIKSGNAAILRGGSDSFHSSMLIASCLHEGLRKAGLPEDAIQLVPTTDRAAVGEMLTLTGLIDIIVPRGGKSLTERIARESRIPTIQHLDGNCHTYIHAAADAAKAVEVTLNAKMRRTGICGATESLIVDESVIDSILPPIVDALMEKNCVLRGDARACQADNRLDKAKEEDWGTEYLDAILSVKTVKGVEEAVAHVNRYGSHHTDAIITEDEAAAATFSREVDSAIVMVNTSTQYADGGEFGMGAEIGISTGRLHARGPVGAEQLTTYKYVVTSDGAARP